jgi:hypothetical protein
LGEGSIDRITVDAQDGLSPADEEFREPAGDHSPCRHHLPQKNQVNGGADRRAGDGRSISIRIALAIVISFRQIRFLPSDRRRYAFC